MASTWDMMVSLALLPGVFVGWCWAKASGLGREGQYRGRLHARSAPSPACGGGLGWGQVTDDASRKQVTEGGITNIRACCVPPPAFASLRHPPPQTGEGRDHADAVVTPPSKASSLMSSSGP